MDSTATVLGTTELLELILLNLPMLDILQAQRVAQPWRNCVRASLLLQRRLFLAPIPEVEAPPFRTVGDITAQPVQSNPLLNNTFLIRHFEGLQSRVSVIPARGDQKLSQRSINEDVIQSRTPPGFEDIGRRLLRKYDHRFLYTRKPHLPCSRACLLDPTSCPNIPSQPIGAADSYSMESWRAMLACQPPLPRLRLQCTQLEQRRGMANVIATDGVGVTLGDIVFRAAELYRVALKKAGFRINPSMHIWQDVESESKPSVKEVQRNYGADALIVENGKPCVRLQFPWSATLHCNLARRSKPSKEFRLKDDRTSTPRAS